MVKNLNTVERSQKIRLGRFMPDSQADNAILINATEEVVNVSTSGFYVAPITYGDDVTGNTLVYNTQTKEIRDSGHPSHQFQNLQSVTTYGNVTSETVSLSNADLSLVTTGPVGIANASPGHTLSVGSNLWVDDTGSNVLVVSGGVRIEGNLVATGDTTFVESTTLSVSDPLIELGRNNTDQSFLFDLGLIMNRPGGQNVGVSYVEGTDELILAYTQNTATDRYVLADEANVLNVHVYGDLTVSNALTAGVFYGDGQYLSNIATDEELNANVLRIDALETNLDDNSSRIATNTTDLADNSSRISTNTTDLADNSSRVTSLRTDVNSNSFRLSTLYTYHASNVLRIATLETDTSDNAARVEVLESDLADNSSRISVLSSRLLDNSFRISVNTADLASNAVRVSTLETDTADNAARVSVLETDTTDNAARVTVLETDLADNNARVTVLETDLADNNARVSTLETDLADNNARVSVLETDLTDNAARVSTLEILKAPIDNPVFTGVVTGDGGGISNITLQHVSDYGNVTSNTIQFTNTDVSLITLGKVGVNTNAIETGNVFEVNGKLFATQLFAEGTEFNNNGKNKMTGNTSIYGNLQVYGNLTYLESNTVFIQDPILGIGNPGATDSGVICMSGGPGMNVAFGYNNTLDEFIIAHTNDGPEGLTLVPDETRDLNVHVFGTLYSANGFGVSNTNPYSPVYALSIGSNIFAKHDGDLISIRNFADNGIYTTDVTTPKVKTDSGALTLEANATVVTGNLIVQGEVTYVKSTEVKIDDPVLDLANNNSVSATDVGLRLNRPNANVIVAYKGVDEKLVIAHSTTNLSVDESRVMNVEIMGSLFLDQTLNVGANVFISEPGVVTANSFIGDGGLLSNISSTLQDLTENGAESDITIVLTNPTGLDLSGNALVAGNVTAGVFYGDGQYLANVSNTANVTLVVTDLADNASRISVLETDLGDNNARVSTLETDLADNNARVSTLETDLADNSARVSTLETYASSNSARVSTLETDLADNSSRIDVVSTDLSDNAARVSTLESDKADLLDPTFDSNITVSNNIFMSDLTATRIVFVGDDNELTDSAALTFGSSLLTVDGDVNVSGNLIVEGSVTQLTTENTIVNDAIIELANNNVSDTLDMGIIMTRPSSNVGIGYRGNESEFMIGHTLSDPSSTDLVPDEANALAVHVYGELTSTGLDVHGSANVGALTTTGITMESTDGGSAAGPELVMWRNSATPANGDYIGEIKFTGENDNGDQVDYAKITGKIGDAGLNAEDGIVEVAVQNNSYMNIIAQFTANDLKLINNTGLEVAGDVTVDTDTFVVDVSRSNVGIGTNAPLFELDVHGNANAHTLNVSTIQGLQTLSFNSLNTSTPPLQLTAGSLNDGVGALRIDSVEPDIFLNDTDGGFSTVTFANNDVSRAAFGRNSGDDFYITVRDPSVDSGNWKDDTLVADSSTGNISLGYKLVVNGGTHTGSNVLDVFGSANAEAYYGDGGFLSNLATNLQEVTERGNTTDQVVSFENPTTALTTDLTANVVVKLDQLSNVEIENPATNEALVYDGSNWVNEEMGIKNYIRVHNNTGSQLDRGKAVYIYNSWNTNVANVALAQSDSPVTMPAIGLMSENVTTGNEGYAVAYGKVNNVDTSAFNEGDTLYVSNTTPGGLSNVKPYDTTNPDLIQNIGICIKKDTNGIVFVTGVGRANDIPNAQIVTSNGDLNYVYVNDENNDMKKIDPTNLLTKIQTLEQVTNGGNTSTLTIELSNATGISATGNVHANQFYGDGQYLSNIANISILESNINLKSDLLDPEFSSNITVSNNAVIHGGTVVNFDTVPYKKYGYASTMTNSNIGVVFTSDVFYAKIIAQLVEGYSNVSTLVLEMQGGKKSGGGTAQDIQIGTFNKFGYETNPYAWSSTVTTTPTKVVMEPTQAGTTDYSYSLSIEYMTSSSEGQVESIEEDASPVATFTY